MTPGNKHRHVLHRDPCHFRLSSKVLAGTVLMREPLLPLRLYRAGPQPYLRFRLIMCMANLQGRIEGVR